MAKKKEEVKKVIKKKDIRQKIIVSQCRHPLFGAEIPYKVLYTEKVASKDIAKQRIEELKKEYGQLEAIHFEYFSL